MGQGAGSRVGTGRYQAVGQTAFTVQSPTVVDRMPARSEVLYSGHWYSLA
jgi:hypothetical protein